MEIFLPPSHVYFRIPPAAAYITIFFNNFSYFGVAPAHRAHFLPPWGTLKSAFFTFTDALATCVLITLPESERTANPPIIESLKQPLGQIGPLIPGD